jgi:hypothetical protein
MLPVTPSELATAASEFAKILPAVTGGMRRWQVWRKLSPDHKQARLLYLEVVNNLLLARHGQRAHPPALLLTRAEWARPTTPALLAKVLDEKQIILVTAAYLQLAMYERLFRQSWVELLPARASGADIDALRRVGDQFAAAEEALRVRLYSGKGQAALAKAIAEDIGRLALPAEVTRRDRYRNASGSIPLGVKLGALLVLGAWRSYALVMNWSKPAGRGRRRTGSARWPQSRRRR